MKLTELTRRVDNPDSPIMCLKIADVKALVDAAVGLRHLLSMMADVPIGWAVSHISSAKWVLENRDSGDVEETKK